jgi:hypothetical protein
VGKEVFVCNYNRIIEEMLLEKREIEIMFPRINETCIFQKEGKYVKPDIKGGNGDAALMPRGEGPKRDLL